MIARIARKEFIEMTRDGRLRWAAALVFALLAVALLTGWRHYADTARQRAAARQDERARWLEQGQKNPHSAAHYGVYAFKPELPLSALDQGLNAYLGVAVWLEAHKQNLFKFRPAEDATAAARFGELTAAVTMQVLIPLLIILLLHAAFTGEREQGTWRLLQSLGVTARQLAGGKVLGAVSVLALLLVPAALLGAAAMMLFANGDNAPASFGRTLVLALGYLVYFGVFIGASLLVSARAKTSQLALIVLLAGWFFNSFVAPRVVTDVAGKLRPVPSAQQIASGIERDLEQGLDGHSTQGERVEELKARTLKQYGVNSIEALPVNFSGIQLEAADEYSYQVYDKHLTTLFDTWEWQNRAYQLAAAAAPLLAVQSLSMGLSGTDFAQHRDFTTRAESYRRGVQKQMSDALTYGSKTGDYVMAGNELWQKVPDFVYSPPSLGWVMRQQSLSLLLLVGWLAATTALLLFVTKKLRAE